MNILEKAADRIKLALGKALLRAVDDSQAIQLVKISGLAGEGQDGIERLQSYGLSSVPPNDSEVLVGYFGGNRDHGVVLVVDNGDSRPKNLNPGETIFYSEYGQRVLCSKDGTLHAMGDTDFAVRFSKLEDAFNEFQDNYNAHAHPGSVDSLAGVCVITTPTTSVPPEPSLADMGPAKVEEIKVP